MTAIGYEYLRTTLRLSAFQIPQPALIKPVTRVERTPGFLGVPGHVAPQTERLLDHVLFALKHEGVNLQVLAEALPRLPPEDLLAEIQRTPNGGYIRMTCFLWETFTGKTLEGTPNVGGAAVDLFDPERYVTGPDQRNMRWRVNFNGLGSVRYCATVERTPAIESAMRSDLLGRASTFLETLGKPILDRTLAWAYLHETEDSFAIEREIPSEEKARAFIALLHQAHNRRPLDEDYLVELQNATVTNPLDKAPAFRHEQNWLSGPGRGAAAVTYVPPPPALIPDLMDEVMRFANEASGRVDPIVAASVTSFGFVFAHPFGDGNGRLSRFLFHHALCQSGRLPNGLVLPVSVAMKKHEVEYLAALQAFSRPARERWTVQWIDAETYTFTFNGSEGLYRYWDATLGVEFGFKMAELALDAELRSETQFLARYDAIVRAVNEQADIRGSDLNTLVLSAIDNGGVVSKRRRDQFQFTVPETTFAIIEEAVRNSEQATDDEDDVAHPRP